MATTEEHVTSLREVGYAVFPHVYSLDYVDLCKAELERLYGEMGRPALRSEGGFQDVGRCDGSLSSVGLTFRKLLKNAPALVAGFLHPEVLAVLRATLGDGLRIETTGATMSDSTRLIHPWHQHVGGLDEDRPTTVHRETLDAASIRRLSLLIYIDPLGPETGPLWLYPRRLSDPVGCPFPGGEREPWPGQITLTCGAGTAVLAEERTWHASVARILPGVRRFVAAWLASASAPRTQNVDDSVPLFEDAALHRRVA